MRPLFGLSQSQLPSFPRASKLVRVIVAILLSALISVVASAQVNFVTNEIPALASLNPTSIKAGDYDRDGDPDLLIQYLSGTWKAQIFTNTSTATTISFVSTTNIFDGAASFIDWVDYNKDGWLDVLVNGGGASAIYIQSGSSFSLLSGTLPGSTSYGYFELTDSNNDSNLELIADNLYIDYDKDGDLDFFNNGLTTNRDQTFIKTHTFWDGVKESQQTSRAPGFILDYDNNGQPDIAYVERSTKVEQGTVNVMLNNGGTFTKYMIDSWPTYNGSIHIAGFGDFNSNGKPELIVYCDASGFFGAKTVNFFEYGTSAPVNVYTVSYPATAYGTDMTASCIADFNSDGKLDLIAYHQYIDDAIPAAVDKFYSYRNTTAATNTYSTAPTGLNSFVKDGEVKLWWNRATDVLTNAQGITYNLEIRNGIDYFVSPNSLPSGRLLQPTKGNVQQADSIVMRLPNGQYDWSVSSVDGHNLSGTKSVPSKFNITNSFDQPKTSTLTNLESIVLSDNRMVVVGSQSGDIYFQFLDSYGSRTTLLTKVNTNTTGNDVPRIAYNPTANQFLVIWKGTYGAEAGKLWGRAFTTAGAPATAEFQVNELEAVAPGPNVFDYDLVYNSKRNQYRVVWSFGYYSLRTRAINASTFSQGAISIHRNGGDLSGDILTIDKIRLGISPNSENIMLSYGTSGIPFNPTPQTKYSFVELLNTDFVGSAPVQLDNLGVQSIAYNPYDSSFALAFEEYTYRNTDVSSFFIQTSEIKVGIAKLAKFPTIQLISGVSESFVQGGTGGAYNPSIELNLARNEWLVLWRNTVDTKVHGRKIDGHLSSLVGIEEFILSDFSGAVTDLEYISNGNQNFLVAGNQFSIIKLPKDAPPVVERLRTNIAYAGDTLTIFGKGFGRTPYLNTVKFGNLTAKVDTVFFSTTKLRVRVPSGLTRDRVAVTVTFDDQPSNDNILFENRSLQAVSGISLDEGKRGDLLTISGTGFATDSTKYSVMFGPVPAQPTDFVKSRPTSIQVKIPQAALRGKWPITVVIQDQPVRAPDSLRVIVPPVITDVTVANDEFFSCRQVTITGENFSDNRADVLIKFGNVPARPEDVLIVSSTAISVKVPIGASGKGKISVTMADGIAESDEKDVFLGSSFVREPVDMKYFDLTQSGDNDVEFDFTVKDGCSVKKVLLYEKGISQSKDSWRSTELLLDDKRGTFTLKEDDFTDPIGVNFYVEITDESDSVIHTEITPYYLQKHFEELDSANQIPDLVFGGDVSDYNIVSIPFTLSPNNVPSVLNSVVSQHGSDITQWRLAHYDETKQEYVEYPKGLSVIEPGKGYWMIVRKPIDIFIDGAEVVDVSGGPFKIKLEHGWNQIGNPYDFNIDWNHVLTENGVSGLESLKIYEGGVFQASTTLKRYRGGFVMNPGGTLTLEIPYDKNPSINGGRIKNDINSDLSTDNWFVPLAVSSSVIGNRISGIGIRPDAIDGVDKFDEHNLPKFSNQLELSFADNLAVSVQSAEVNRKWEFTIDNTTDEDQLTLSWNNKDFGDNEIGIVLYDKQYERLIDMRTTNKYAFTYRDNNRFAIYVGDAEYLAGNLQPEHVTLGEAYPNPFRKETNIPFAVAHDDTHVRVVMYNLQGQQITILSDQKYSSGFYEVSWNGNDQNGNRLPAGAYICQLQTQAGNQAKSQNKRVVLE